MSVPVWFVLTPNVLLLDYAGPAEALRMAAEMGGDLLLHHCAPTPRLGTSLTVELGGLSALPPELPPNSLVIVTGNACDAQDYARPEAHAVVDWLRRTPRADTCTASICSGALLLAAAGLLDHRRCTTHHSLIDGRLSVERVAELSGFNSARDFRRVWQRHEADTPSARRRRTSTAR